MFRFVFILAFAVVLTGCSHTRHLNPVSPGDRAEINERGSSTATVTLRSGESVKARSLHVAEDVTTWNDPQIGSPESISTNEIDTIQYTNRGRGFLEGAGIGLGVGLVAGAVIALADGSEPENVGEAVGESIGDAVVLVGVPILGAAAGGAVGAGIGSRTTYTPTSTGREP